MEGFSRRPRKELIGVVQGVSGKRGCLVRFKDLCEKDITLNQLITVKLERSPVTKKSNIPTISVIPDDTIDFVKG